MSNQRGVGPFCSMVVATLAGSSNSVAATSGIILGAGAQIYCLANNKSYRYTTSTITAASPVFIAAAGGGTWMEENAVGDSSVAIQTQAGYASSTLTSASATWQALPSGAGFYGQSTTSPLWSLNTTSGVLTYLGPTGAVYLMTASFIFAPSSSSGDTGFSLTQNGALIGTSGFVAGQVQMANLVASENTQLSQAFQFQPVNGATYQHVWIRGVGGTYVFTGFQSSYTLLP